MNFNSHSNIAGQHAFLSASNYHWINYDLEKLTGVWNNAQAARRGTQLHAFAHDAIRLGVKLPRTSKTLNMYVNDAIGYRMTTEQMLYYSSNCFGTCDAISFTKDFLRIHDLKTGVTPGSMNQLKVYMAFFCLEYAVKPGMIEAELRIYQDDEIEVCVPEIDEIAHLMSKIIVFDGHLETMKIGGQRGA
jgi:hypothetical protein